MNHVSKTEKYFSFKSYFTAIYYIVKCKVFIKPNMSYSIMTQLRISMKLVELTRFRVMVFFIEKISPEGANEFN